MSKQNSIIFICFVSLSLLSGCGVKKSLYQTPEKVEQSKQETPKTDDNHNKEQSHYQQEKR